MDQLNYTNTNKLHCEPELRRSKEQNIIIILLLKLILSRYYFTNTY